MKKYNSKVKPNNETEYSKSTPSVDVEKIRKAFNSKWEALFTYDRDTTNGFNPYLRCENKVFDFFQPYLQPTKDSWDSVIDKVIEVLQNMDKEVVDDDYQSALIDRKEAVMLILALKTKQKETE